MKLEFNNCISYIFSTILFLSILEGCGTKDIQNNPPPPPNAPLITNFSPTSGVAGDQITINGSNFNSSVAGNVVKFNNSTATIASATSTLLTVTVPNGAATGKISVTANGATTTSSADFVIEMPPTISNFIPTIGKAGDQIIINGTNFSSTSANNLVAINGTSTSVVSSSSTQLTITIPTGATSGSISVTLNNRTATSSATLNVFSTFVSTFAGSSAAGLLDAMGAAARFDHPEGIAKDAAGNMYVADSYNRSIRKITPAGQVSTIVTFSSSTSEPYGLTLDASGNIFVADRNWNRIWKVSPIGTITAIAGNGVAGNTNGQGNAALFNSPTDIAIDASGNLYVADLGNRLIRKITPTGLVSTFAGSDTSQTYDGIGVASSFIAPRGITIDGFGNLYVADHDRIRKITSSAVVSTIAGSFGAGYVDGPAFSAKFFNPRGIAIDPTGNIYVADKIKIRKITTDGYVVTIAGNGNYGFADGPGSIAEFNYAEGIIVDASGNLFITDYSNNRIRKVTF